MVSMVSCPDSAADDDGNSGTAPVSEHDEVVLFVREQQSYFASTRVLPLPGRKRRHDEATGNRLGRRRQVSKPERGLGVY
jgi:hypothetical protein